MKNTVRLFLITMVSMCTACEPAVNNKPGASSKGVQRFGMITGLKPEKLDYYKQLHANAWPAVIKKLQECHIQNYSIYLKEVDGKPFLFSYFEYTGSNFESDMEKMAADSTTQRWWKETDPCQVPLPEAASGGKIWSTMEEVFHSD